MTWFISGAISAAKSDTPHSGSPDSGTTASERCSTPASPTGIYWPRSRRLPREIRSAGLGSRSRVRVSTEVLEAMRRWAQS